MHLDLQVGRLVDALTGQVVGGAALDKRIRRRTALFAALGLQHRDRVLLNYGNRPEFFIDLMAIWSIGACAVPLDPRATAVELGNVSNAARPRLSIWHDNPPADAAAAITSAGARILDTAEERDTPPGYAPSTSWQLEDEALILFTSGTTGQPKGVVHTHRSLRARWTALRDNLGTTAAARTMCLLPTHFGHGLICNSLYPWLSGQDLFILPPFRADLLLGLGDLIDRHRITFMSSVPPVWRMALKMAMRIEQVCGRSIALSRLLEGVTIERLADILMEGEQANFGKPLVAVQARGSKQPLYWLHGDFDHGGLNCHSLARLLGADQPFYALTPHGLDGRELPWSIEEMATERLTALRQVQPHGPYRLGGFCIGGVVAFEMARQLRDQGEQVDIVLLVDARAVNTPWPFRPAARALRSIAGLLRWREARRRRAYLTLRMRLWAFRVSAMPGGQGRLKFILDKCTAVARRLRPAPAPDTAVIQPLSAAGSDADVHWARFCAYLERLDDYLPRRFDGPVVLFRSSHLDDKPPGGATAGWDRVADRVDVHYLPGNHQACVTRHVAVLAGKMRPYLA